MDNSLLTQAAEPDPKPWYGRPILWICLAALVMLWLLTTSWNSSAPSRVQKNDAQRAANAEDGFDSAINQLHNVDDNSSPVALQQVTERVNQWLQHNQPSGSWKPDAMLQELPESLRTGGVLNTLDSPTMQPDFDKHFLHDAAMFRRASQANRGDANDPRKVALRLFDWTVRGIQVDPPVAGIRVRRPMDALLIGHADPDLRAWIFVELARQQGLTVVQLALGDPDQPAKLKPWAQALLHEGDLYLFDMSIGLPIPGPEGRDLATLAEVAADDKLLRALDVSENRPYPITAADLNRVTAWIAAPPGLLARRMAIVESRLAGDSWLALSMAPSAVAEQVRKSAHVAAVQLWKVPYETLSATFRRLPADDTAAMAATSELAAEHLVFLDPALTKGRILHLRARFALPEDGPADPNANKLYQIARYEGVDLTREAEQRVRDEVQQRMAKGERPGEHFDPNRMRDAQVQLLTKVREYASYWLGLAAFERGQLDAAEDYLKKRTMLAYPDGRWFDGARYNLARLYESDGRLEQAIELYEQDTSEQRHGSLLRAQRLRGKITPAGEQSPAKN